MSETISFTVPGRVPSKSNYRHSAKAAAQWRRIKRYEQDAALSAMAAGARERTGSGLVHLKILLVNQRLDVDNASKICVDSLKGVAYPDDAQTFLKSVLVAWDEDSGPVRAEFRIEWEEA